MVEMSISEFAAEPLKVKRLAQRGPVIITEGGRPELVVLPYERWRALVPQDLVEALGDEAVADIDFDVPPSSLKPRAVDLGDK